MISNREQTILVSVIGTAGCNCYGELKLACKRPEEVPIKSYPKECTSVFYNCLLVNSDLSTLDPTLERLGIKGIQ